MVTQAMPRPLSLAAALLIASMAIGCQGGSPAAPAEDEFDEEAQLEAQLEALVALYNSTDGDNWQSNDGWLESDDPCPTVFGEFGWYGVRCTLGHVSGLYLGDNNLSGTIPAELGNLSLLGTLRLGPPIAGLYPGNNLTGPIPAELGNLTRLVFLELTANNLTGPIPAELGNLTALGDLSLAGNQLSGPIPAELADLTALTTMDLYSNGLSGSVPLRVAALGGAIEQGPISSYCSFESNPGLFMPDSQEYMDADLDNGGFICGIPLGTPSS